MTDGRWAPGEASLDDDGELSERVEEYWGWVAVALYLLTTVDVLTTLFAAADVGAVYEANPLVQWLLRQSIPGLVTLNLAVVVVVAVGFRGIVATLRRTPAPIRPYYALVIEAWLGLLVALGLFVFANNVSVIVLGESLL